MKIKKFVVCHGATFDFNVAVVGSGRNPKVYVMDQDQYWNDKGQECSFKQGTDARWIDDVGYLLHMDLDTWKKISKVIL